MRVNATAVANEFVELARRDNKELHLLGLTKRVYLAHAFSLALHGRSLLDDRFDKCVEAWKLGPVIPSVYQSFKHYRNGAITDKESVLLDDGRTFVEPSLDNEGDKAVVEMVWVRYGRYTDSELVTLLHRKGTPWRAFYVPGMNNPIPDKYTKLYYEGIVENNRRQWQERS